MTMFRNAVSIDFIEEINKTGLISERYAQAKPRPILYIAVLLSAVFHIYFLFGFASDYFHNKRADSAANQPIDMQLQIVRDPAELPTSTTIESVESVLESPVLENLPRVVTAETTIPAEDEIAEIVEEATAEPSIDLSEVTIRTVVEKVMQGTAEYEEALEGAYANGFDSRFHQKLIDSQNREPPPEKPELASWITGTGQVVAQFSDTHCIRSTGASSVGAIGGGGTTWGLPYKCAPDEGDRMMERVTARISDYLR